MLFDAALSAWATLALAVLALIAAVVAGCAWLVQARQLSALREVNDKQLPVLEGQRTELEESRELRKREERERREQFVSQVFSYTETGPDRRVSQAQTASGAKAGWVIRTYIRNTAPVPLYDLAFAVWVDDQLRSWVRREKPLMPGTWAAPAESTESWPWDIPEDVDRDDIAVAVFVRDAAGNRWRVRPDGHYDEYQEGMLPEGTVWRTI